MGVADSQGAIYNPRGLDVHALIELKKEGKSVADYPDRNKLGAEKYIHEKGVLYVPDFIANAGGVICAAMECQRACQSAAFPAIEERPCRNTRLVLEDAATKGILPREAAMDLAVQRLKKSMSYRRWSLFSAAPGFV